MGEHVGDDTLVRPLARAVLDRDAGDDAGRAAYQLAIHECDHYGAAHAEGGGELVPIDPVVLEAARCDAQEIGPVHAGTRTHDRAHVGPADGCTRDATGAASHAAAHETTHDLGRTAG